MADKYILTMETLEKLRRNNVDIDGDEIAALCKRYSIKEMAIFGSSLRGDFSAESDIDILVSFADDSEISLFDIVNLQAELEAKLHRTIDLVEKEALKNPIRKKTILATSETIYAA